VSAQFIQPSPHLALENVHERFGYSLHARLFEPRGGDESLELAYAGTADTPAAPNKTRRSASS
jgi:hypothetical protein